MNALSIILLLEYFIGWNGPVPIGICEKPIGPKVFHWYGSTMWRSGSVRGKNGEGVKVWILSFLLLIFSASLMKENCVATGSVAPSLLIRYFIVEITASAFRWRPLEK